MKKICIGITGATGSLGKVIIRNNKSIIFNRFDGDIRNRKAVFDWIKRSNINIVFHLAAIVPIKEVNRNTNKARQVNYDGTKNIVDACIKKKKKWFFFHLPPMFTSRHVKKYLKVLKKNLYHIMAKQNCGQKTILQKNLSQQI